MIGRATEVAWQAFVLSLAFQSSNALPFNPLADLPSVLGAAAPQVSNILNAIPGLPTPDSAQTQRLTMSSLATSAISQARVPTSGTDSPSSTSHSDVSTNAQAQPYTSTSSSSFAASQISRAQPQTTSGSSSSPLSQSRESVFSHAMPTQSNTTTTYSPRLQTSSQASNTSTMAHNGVASNSASLQSSKSNFSTSVGSPASHSSSKVALTAPPCSTSSASAQLTQDMASKTASRNQLTIVAPSPITTKSPSIGLAQASNQAVNPADNEVSQSSTSRPAKPTSALPAVSPSTLQAMSTVTSVTTVTNFMTVYTRASTSGVSASAPLLSFSNGEAKPTATVATLSLTKSPVVLATQAANDLPGSIDPFKAIGTSAPAAQLTFKDSHPVPTANIVAPKEATLQTNKFYANLFLATQEQSVFALPYTLNWVNGSGGTKSYGMAIQHVDGNQRVNAPTKNGPVEYYTNPVNTQQLVLTANELESSADLTVDSLDTFSVNANLSPAGSGNGMSAPIKRSANASKITFPIVQGMGFVTGLYTTLQPEITTSGSFTNVTAAGSIGTAYKYRASLNDGTQWFIYAIPDDRTTPVNFTLATNKLLRGPKNWSGMIQMAKNPANSSSEGIYDVSAGVYATKATLSGKVNGRKGQYTLSYSTEGQNLNNGTYLGFALPHMAQSFDNSTNSSIRAIKLQTPAKGVATAVTANSWTMTESDLPTDMSFTPWTPTAGTTKNYSSAAVNAIYAAAQTELTEDIDAQTNLNSMYYSGKAFSKFASILVAVNDICQEPDLAKQGVAKLESSLNRFINNQQQNPLVYDTVWKGVVSSASYGGDSGADFGNTYYNDHHFHYGYFLHAAAVMAHLDPTWLNTSSNRAWVDSLARDVSNPSSEDTYFPVFRYFDWFQGHSWAHGLYETADGKDQESSSEDVMFSYGLKMWGQATGDKSMEARGNLMLAVQARSLQSYFLLADNNENQPKDFIGNKVTGILFENKVDHTTYFGTNSEYIQGIHMLPLQPSSPLIRTSTFVQQEWNTYFAENATDPAGNVAGGWRGVLYANLALTDPKASWDFFSAPGFDMDYLDGGASRTWYLALAAGLGGAS